MNESELTELDKLLDDEASESSSIVRLLRQEAADLEQRSSLDDGEAFLAKLDRRIRRQEMVDERAAVEAHRAAETGRSLRNLLEQLADELLHTPRHTTMSMIGESSSGARLCEALDAEQFLRWLPARGEIDMPRRLQVHLALAAGLVHSECPLERFASVPDYLMRGAWPTHNPWDPPPFQLKHEPQWLDLVEPGAGFGKAVFYSSVLRRFTRMDPHPNRTVVMFLEERNGRCMTMVQEPVCDEQDDSRDFLQPLGRRLQSMIDGMHGSVSQPPAITSQNAPDFVILASWFKHQTTPKAVRYTFGEVAASVLRELLAAGERHRTPWKTRPKLDSTRGIVEKFMRELAENTESVVLPAPGSTSDTKVTDTALPQAAGRAARELADALLRPQVEHGGPRSSTTEGRPLIKLGAHESWRVHHRERAEHAHSPGHPTVLGEGELSCALLTGNALIDVDELVMDRSQPKTAVSPTNKLTVINGHVEDPPHMRPRFDKR